MTFVMVKTKHIAIVITIVITKVIVKTNGNYLVLPIVLQ